MNLKTLLPTLAVVVASAISAVASAQTTIIHHGNGTTTIRKVAHSRRHVVYVRHRSYHRHPRVIVVDHSHRHHY